MAADAKVEVGDKIVFNVQGVLMETTVGSIRQVDWGRMQLNFSIVFPKGVLEDAPQFSVFTTAAENEQVSANLQRNLVEKFPNVTIIDLRQVFNIVEVLSNFNIFCFLFQCSLFEIYLNLIAIKLQILHQLHLSK